MPTPSHGEIKPYIENGLVTEREHPTDARVRIYNYTPAAQFSRAWDDVTRSCRGLVLNVETNDVLANPFPKFFNYQEHLQNEWPIPTETPIITEKLDGSLGILVHVDDAPWIATRGSFASEQAQWATRWWREHMAHADRVVGDNAVTHLFEIIYPQNRIVVSYDYEGLVYLGSRVTATGEHVDCRGLFERTPVRVAREIPRASLEQLAALDEPNSEGFVVHYPIANVRLKIKFAEYVRLHKLVTGLSEIAIWEHMRDGHSLADIIGRVPDEFFEFVTTTQARLQAQYDAIEQEARAEYADAIACVGDDCTRKEVALAFQAKKHRGVLFSMLDGRPYAEAIWRQIRPIGQSSFTTDIDS